MQIDELTNLTGQSTGELYSWLPHDLQAEHVVFLPDACPGRAPLPTGTAVLTRQPDWRKFAVSDCGCGMRLVRTDLTEDDLTQELWDEAADVLRSQKGGLGDLGGGNHFVDALMPQEEAAIYLLIHTGSRDESRRVEDLTDKPFKFDQVFFEVVQWASDNRKAVQHILEDVVGSMECVLDLPHNTYEPLQSGGAIIRKGSAHVRPGELNIIPSHIDGDVALVRATDNVEQILGSLSHGTGRAMSRSEAKKLAPIFDMDALRDRVLIPESIDDASLRTDGPFAYRDLDPSLELIDDYVTVERRFGVKAYLGHL